MGHDISVFIRAGKTCPLQSLSHPSQPSLSHTLVIHGDVTEQVGHGLSVVDAADGFSQYHADIYSLDFGTLKLLYFMGDCVGDHHLRGG